jgi:hypothetical protein
VPKHPKCSRDASVTGILPTVSRVLWFMPARLYGDGIFTHIGSRKPLAAIVAHVFRDDLVNLAVFDSNGMSHSRISAPLCRKNGCEAWYEGIRADYKGAKL